MQDFLQLRFSLVGGMFESIPTTMQSITDCSTLVVQLVVLGVIFLTINMVIDKLSNLIQIVVNCNENIRNKFLQEQKPEKVG